MNLPEEEPTQHFSEDRWSSGWLLGGVLIAAALIRIRSAMNDLWLDEIWSLSLMGKITSPLEVFTKIRYDNNHYLNSLWLFWMGARGNWAGYRMPSVMAGVGSVIMAGIIGHRRNSRTAFFAIFLMAFSYVQILYSSEARGYSEVVFFSFLSFYALEKYMEKPASPFAVLFSVSSILGFASQLIFLNFYAAAILWSCWRCNKEKCGWQQVVKSMLACHAAPTAFFVALYFVNIRHLVTGGGTDANIGATFGQSLAWTFGAWPGRLGIWFGVLLTIVLCRAGIRVIARERPDSLIFFIGVIVVFPIFFILIHHSDVIYVRYFLIGMAFLLLLFSFVLARLYESSPAGRLVCVALMAAYLAVNGWNTLTLFKYGRGQYADAVQYMIKNTKGPNVTVGSDHDFRVSLVLQFYADEATGDKTVEYYKMNSWPRGGPEWVIYHKESFQDTTPPPVPVANKTNHFVLAKTFSTAPLSGLQWFVYHNPNFEL